MVANFHNSGSPCRISQATNAMTKKKISSPSRMAIALERFVKSGQFMLVLQPHKAQHYNQDDRERPPRDAVPGRLPRVWYSRPRHGQGHDYRDDDNGQFDWT